MKIILFSESEIYYRSLGLKNSSEYNFEFDGMRKYKNINIDKYDFFVCSFYTLPHNVILTLKFNKRGKKTILVSDGVFDFSNSFFNPMQKKFRIILYFPIIQDYFIIADKSAKKFFSDQKIEVLDYMPSRMISKNSKITMPHEINILITTANSPYFDEYQYQRLLNLIVKVVLCLVENKIKFSFRLYDDKLIKDLSKIINYSVLNDVEHNFEDTIAIYSHVITTPSSISITAMYHDRKVMTLINSTIPVNIQSAWNLSNIEDVDFIIKDFLSFNKEKNIIQDKLLVGYLSDNTLNDTLLNVIDNKIDSEIKNYINTSMYNMLESKFNINFEYYVRTIYKKIPRNKLIKKLKVLLK